MKLKTILTMSTAALALSAGAAHATGPYVSFFGGLTMINDDPRFGASGSSTYATTFTTTGTFFLHGSLNYTVDWSDNFENGWSFGAAFGMDILNGFRGEIEGSFRRANIDGGANVRALVSQYFQYTYIPETGGTGESPTPDVLYIGRGRQMVPEPLSHTGKYGTLTGAYGRGFAANIPAQTDGQSEVWSLLANLWYDFDLGGPLHPFIGGGIGAAMHDSTYRARGQVTLVTFSGSTFTTSVTYRAEGDGTVLAYQFGGGLRYLLGNGASLSAQYRYFGTGDADLGNRDHDLGGHNFLIGFTMELGAMQ